MALRVSLALLARDIVAFGSFPIIIAIACAGASFLALFEGVFLSRLAVPVSRLSSEAADAR